MAITLPPAVFGPFERFSLHNSPYPAHVRGAAVDLYPGDAIDSHPGGGTRAPSPVAGEVVDTRTVEAPPREYAADHDHLILVDVERPTTAAGLVARLMHVDPVVESGERVAVGDDLGELVRSGFYAPWVPDHVHLGFRNPNADPYRARGSLRLDPGVDVEPVAWDGTGEVVATGETYAVLDGPLHPAPGECFAGIAATVGPGSETAVVDGGLPHYDGGGLLGATEAEGTVAVSGHRVGTATGRDVAWDDIVVRANGQPITGLSLFCGRDADFGVKLVGPAVGFAVGDEVEVALTPPPE